MSTKFDCGITEPVSVPLDLNIQLLMEIILLRVKAQNFYFSNKLLDFYRAGRGATL